MANVKGGYLAIDFTGVEIDTTGITIAGIYDKIEGATKPILAQNIYAPDGFGELILNVYVTPSLSSTDFVILENSSYTLNVTSLNKVKLVAKSSNAKSKKE